MTTEIQERHKKQAIAMRAWLEGRGYWQAADAFELVLQLEVGTRKDGVTPKAHHQLSVARLVQTLEPHLKHSEETITVAFLHDVLEDHSDKWSRELLEARFNKRIADAVWTITKKSGGLVKDTATYYAEVASCPIASVVKLADRNHNIQTMSGVFTAEKQARYVQEVEDYYYPMIKTARRTFRSQYAAYENLKILLRCQCRLIKAMLSVGTQNAP